jgi:hypothetical protein
MLENRNEQQMPDSSGCQTYIVLAIVVQNSTQLPWGAKKYIVRKTLTSGSSENFLRQGGLQPSMALTWLRPCVWRLGLDARVRESVWIIHGFFSSSLMKWHAASSAFENSIMI